MAKGNQHKISLWKRKKRPQMGELQRVFYEHYKGQQAYTDAEKRLMHEQDQIEAYNRVAASRWNYLNPLVALGIYR